MSLGRLSDIAFRGMCDARCMKSRNTGSPASRGRIVSGGKASRGSVFNCSSWFRGYLGRRCDNLASYMRMVLSCCWILNYQPSYLFIVFSFHVPVYLCYRVGCRTLRFRECVTLGTWSLGTRVRPPAVDELYHAVKHPWDQCLTVLVGFVDSWVCVSVCICQ